MSGKKMGCDKAYGPKAYGPLGASGLERGALKTSGKASEAKAHGPRVAARLEHGVANLSKAGEAKLATRATLDGDDLDRLEKVVSLYGDGLLAIMERGRVAVMLPGVLQGMSALIDLARKGLRYAPCDCAEANQAAGRPVVGCSKCPAGES